MTEEEMAEAITKMLTPHQGGKGVIARIEAQCSDPLSVDPDMVFKVLDETVGLMLRDIMLAHENPEEVFEDYITRAFWSGSEE